MIPLEIAVRFMSLRGKVSSWLLVSQVHAWWRSSLSVHHDRRSCQSNTILLIVAWKQEKQETNQQMTDLCRTYPLWPPPSKEVLLANDALSYQFTNGTVYWWNWSPHESLNSQGPVAGKQGFITLVLEKLHDKTLLKRISVSSLLNTLLSVVRESWQYLQRCVGYSSIC